MKFSCASLRETMQEALRVARQSSVELTFLPFLREAKLPFIFLFRIRTSRFRCGSDLFWRFLYMTGVDAGGVYVITDERGVAVGCGMDCMAALESKSIKNTSWVGAAAAAVAEDIEGVIAVGVAGIKSVRGLGRACGCLRSPRWQWRLRLKEKAEEGEWIHFKACK